MVRVCCEIKVSKRARLLCLRAQSTTRAAASSAVCCCSNFEHGGRCDGRPSTGLVPADPDRGGTCPVSRCCGVTTPLAWWRETALWWAAVLWLWVGGVTRSQKGHCGPCCCAFAIPQLFCLTSAAVPNYLRSCSALHRVSHGTSFLAPGSLARRRLERLIHHHQSHTKTLLWGTSNKAMDAFF